MIDGHLKWYNLLNDKQYGFLPLCIHRWCPNFTKQNHQNVIASKINEVIDNKLITKAIALDISKALNKVWRKEVLHKHLCYFWKGLRIYQVISIGWIHFGCCQWQASNLVLSPPSRSWILSRHVKRVYSQRGSLVWTFIRSQSETHIYDPSQERLDKWSYPWTIPESFWIFLPRFIITIVRPDPKVQPCLGWRCNISLFQTWKVSKEFTLPCGWWNICTPYKPFLNDENVASLLLFYRFFLGKCSDESSIQSRSKTGWWQRMAANVAQGYGIWIHGYKIKRNLLNFTSQ